MGSRNVLYPITNMFLERNNTLNPTQQSYINKNGKLYPIKYQYINKREKYVTTTRNLGFNSYGMIAAADGENIVFVPNANWIQSYNLRTNIMTSRLNIGTISMLPQSPWEPFRHGLLSKKTGKMIFFSCNALQIGLYDFENNVFKQGAMLPNIDMNTSGRYNCYLELSDGNIFGFFPQYNKRSQIGIYDPAVDKFIEVIDIPNDLKDGMSLSVTELTGNANGENAVNLGNDRIMFSLMGGVGGTNTNYKFWLFDYHARKFTETSFVFQTNRVGMGGSPLSSISFYPTRISETKIFSIPFGMTTYRNFRMFDFNLLALGTRNILTSTDGAEIVKKMITEIIVDTTGVSNPAFTYDPGAVQLFDGNILCPPNYFSNMVIVNPRTNQVSLGVPKPTQNSNFKSGLAIEGGRRVVLEPRMREPVGIYG